MGFVAKYLFFLDQGHIANPIEVVFSAYFIGIVFWTFVMFAVAEGDQRKVLAAMWAEALGHILFLSIVMGEGGWIAFGKSFVRVLPMTVHSATALIGHKLFLDNDRNPIAHLVFSLIATTVYCLFLGSPWLVVLLSPVFVAVASHVVDHVDDIEADTTFGFLIMTTILLGLLLGYLRFG